MNKDYLGIIFVTVEYSAFNTLGSLRHIIADYDTSVRPVFNASSVVNIFMGLTLTHIFNIVNYPKQFYGIVNILFRMKEIKY